MFLTFSKTEGVKRSGFGLTVVSTVICLGGMKTETVLRYGFGLVGL